MIRVLHTIDTTGPGGAETVFVSLAKGLDKQCFESFAAIPGPGWVCDALGASGIKPFFVCSWGGFNAGYLGQLVRIVCERKIDVIQSHLFGSNLYAAMAGLICRVPVISVIHGFVDLGDKERLIWLKTRLVNLGSSRIVFVSDHLRRHCVGSLGFSGKKSVTIYNGVDTTAFYPNKDHSIRKYLGIEDKHFVIGAMGNIRPAKGYDLFLRAAAKIYEQNSQCRFVVAGQGSGALYQELLDLRRDLGLEKVFFFMGFQPEPATVYNNFDVFVLPSTSEGFSISTIEAMACGLPVVVTGSGGPEEIVEHGVNGLLAGINPDEIANTVSWLISNPLLRKRLGRTAVDAVRQKFGLDITIEAYQRLILLSSRCRA